VLIIISPRMGYSKYKNMSLHVATDINMSGTRTSYRLSVLPDALTNPGSVKEIQSRSMNSFQIR